MAEGATEWQSPTQVEVATIHGRLTFDGDGSIMQVEVTAPLVVSSSNWSSKMPWPSVGNISKENYKEDEAFSNALVKCPWPKSLECPSTEPGSFVAMAAEDFVSYVKKETKARVKLRCNNEGCVLPY